MAVRKEKNGTWTLDYRYFDIIEQKNKRYKKRGFSQKKEALNWLSENAKKESIGTFITFGEIFKLYQSNSNASDNTKNDQMASMNRHLKKLLNRNYIDITKSEMTIWRNAISELRLSTKTKNLFLTIIKTVTKFAYNNLDLDDKAKHLQPFKPKIDERKEIVVWDDIEFKSFIDCIENPCFNAFFRLLYYSGMRKGEARALLKKDLSDGYVDIYKSIKRGKDDISTTKTKSSIRKIKLDVDTYARCELFKNLDGEYLFGDFEPLSNSKIQRYFTLGIKLSGNNKIRIHDLRHSHATMLINHDANIVAVSRRLGHSDISMTLKVYTHLLSKTDDALMNILENLEK